VPAVIVVDNLKAAVIRAALHEPLINRAYRKVAEYYGFLISPCKPYHPRHKGGVENDIRYVKSSFLPLFREWTKLLGKIRPTLHEMNERLGKWDEEMADVRIISGVGESSEKSFEQERIFKSSGRQTRVLAFQGLPGFRLPGAIESLYRHPSLCAGRK
jgi:hypothetical protein